MDKERIKQLAVEAGAVPTYDGLAFGPVELTAFAQAVARDIIAACHERDLWCMDDPAATVEDVIRARFGLGE